MSDAEIVIENLEPLLTKLGRIDAAESLRPAMEMSLKAIFARLQIYPPPARRKFNFVSDKQRRFVLWAIRTQRIEVPYKRRHSGGLAGAWKSQVSVGLGSIVGVLANRMPYAVYVMSPSRQASYHRNVWPTTKDIVSEMRDTVRGIFDLEIRRLLNG
jgi:hypothetical protein